MGHSQLKYPNDLAEMCDWVADATPEGGRVLEIGSGDGELVRRLRGREIDATGIDPHGEEAEGLLTVALELLDTEPFDVVFSSVALHHVHDLEAGAQALRRLSKPGTTMLVREFDRNLLWDGPTLEWWYRMRQAIEVVDAPDEDDHPLPPTFEEFRDGWRHMMVEHVHPWPAVEEMLTDAGFTCTASEPTAYLFRWGLHEAVRPLEEALIAEGRINRVGIRWAGRRGTD